MQSYQPPLRDMRFVLHEVLGLEDALGQLPGFHEVNAELVDSVLDEAGRIFTEVVFPTNQAGHREGCRLEKGDVRTPTGFKEAYQALVDGGWLSLSGSPEYGGQGLPETLTFCLEEMFCSANVALSLYPALTHGACRAMLAHASEELKQAYLPFMVSGRWTGTMCLTEPQAGTDLGLLRTKAEPREDGSYAVTGTKVFITAGEHDLAENIVHMVLARLPDAPRAVKGISLFLVPKFLPAADGTPGERNAVECVSIEEKMGIKGVPACVMQFEGATGYLVGEPHAGLANMFTMMNHERLAIGLEGLGLSETAYQSAVGYARERRQGRAPNGPAQPEAPADPIMVHPDVRRMLMTTRAFTEGARAFASWVGLNLDTADRHPDPRAREQAKDLVDLLTPVVKAFLTDMGSERCNECLQVFGGAGYISDTGMEQLVRDARIGQIYEGTNGVQANDLVGRKLFLHGGRLVERFFAEAREFAEAHHGDPGLGEYLQGFTAGLAELQGVTSWLKEASKDDREQLGAAACDYLRLFALVCLARMWTAMAKVALDNAEGDNTGFYAAKLTTARYYMQRIMPQCAALAESIRSGAPVLMALEPEAF